MRETIHHMLISSSPLGLECYHAHQFAGPEAHFQATNPPTTDSDISLTSGGAEGLGVSKLKHAVQSLNGDGGLGRAAVICPRA
jgi:hypothetical protein